MNRETRGNMCKNKVVSKGEPPLTKQWESAGAPNSSPPPLAPRGRKRPQIRGLAGKCYRCTRRRPADPSRAKAAGSPFPPEMDLGRGCSRLEKPSQEEEMPGAGCGGKVMCEKAPAPKSPGRSQRSRVESPQRAPGVRGQGAGRGAWWRGLQFFTDEASGGLASGGGGRGTVPVRRRTPPACWASGRLRHWLVWAPPRSSCPRPSSSSGRA